MLEVISYSFEICLKTMFEIIVNCLFASPGFVFVHFPLTVVSCKGSSSGQRRKSHSKASQGGRGAVGSRLFIGCSSSRSGVFMIFSGLAKIICSTSTPESISESGNRCRTNGNQKVCHLGSESNPDRAESNPKTAISHPVSRPESVSESTPASIPHTSPLQSPFQSPKEVVLSNRIPVNKC